MFPVEFYLLIASVLFLTSILFSKASKKFGVPVLLLFLGVGMLFGPDGLGLKVNNLGLAEGISTFALSIVLFSGGLNTKTNDVKPVMKEGIVLATVGVLLTSTFTGLFIYYIAETFLASFNITMMESFLLAAIISSTDSASVFSIFGSKNIFLRNNLRPLIELESGSNDPMAYLLTVLFMQIILTSAFSLSNIATTLVVQLTVGTIAGYALGRLSVLIINKINLDNFALYPALLFALCMFIFSFTHYIKGNGYLSVYIAGLVVGNSEFITKRATIKFFDGFTWLFQITMFLTLGLLVHPKELVHVIAPSILIGLFIIFVGRPASVFISLQPFKKSIKDKLLVSWVGLKGAVPIVFAILPMAAGVPHAKEIFNIVFFITIISLLLQGSSVALIARRLKLTDSAYKTGLHEFELEFSENIKSTASEVIITDDVLKNGNTLKSIHLPDGTLAVMVKRNDSYFIPKGNTELMAGDKLMIISDNEKTLLEAYKAMGVSNYYIEDN